MLFPCCLNIIYEIGRLAYRFNGYSDCIRAATISDGYGVYFRGLNATLLRAFPTNAATFAVGSYSINSIMLFSIIYMQIS